MFGHHCVSWCFAVIVFPDIWLSLCFKICCHNWVSQCLFIRISPIVWQPMCFPIFIIIWIPDGWTIIFPYICQSSCFLMSGCLSVSQSVDYKWLKWVLKGGKGSEGYNLTNSRAGKKRVNYLKSGQNCVNHNLHIQRSNFGGNSENSWTLQSSWGSFFKSRDSWPLVVSGCQACGHS